MIVGKNTVRILVVLLLYAIVSGCASTGSRDDHGKKFAAFHSDTAIEDRVIAARVTASAEDIEPGPNTNLVAAPFLGASPLEIPESTKVLPMLQLAKSVKVLSSVRHNGLSSKDLFSRSGDRIPGLRITRRLLYKNWGDVYADFPFVSKEQLHRYANESATGIALAKWSVEYFFDVSPDRKAYRVIMTGSHFIEHRKPPRSEQESADYGKPPRFHRKPTRSGEKGHNGKAKSYNDSGAFFSAVTYRYPNHDRENVVSMSIVYKLFQHEDQFVYTGGEQSSGWLPLQQAKDKPYNLYISIVHARNFQSLIESKGGMQGFLLWLLGVGSG
ncbi:MAG: hypothetical protein R3188_04135, partial [Acidiferrobacterales bacterium]|nr:hypothetical protein [Acidiferrobacterales bacterium]